MKGNNELFDLPSPEEVLNHIKGKFEAFPKETIDINGDYYLGYINE